LSNERLTTVKQSSDNCQTTDSLFRREKAWPYRAGNSTEKKPSVDGTVFQPVMGWLKGDVDIVSVFL